MLLLGFAHLHHDAGGSATHSTGAAMARRRSRCAAAGARSQMHALEYSPM